MFTPLKNRKIARPLTKHINKKVVNTKTKKRKVGGVVVGIDEDKDLKNLKKLLKNLYPDNFTKYHVDKTITELKLKNVDDLREVATNKIDEYVETIEYEPDRGLIKTALENLTEKLKDELQYLKNRLNEEFQENITDKIIKNLRIRDINDLINARKSDILGLQGTSTTSFTEEQIDKLLIFKKKLKNRQKKLNAKLTKMFSKDISKCLIHVLAINDVYDLYNVKLTYLLYFVIYQKGFNVEMNNKILNFHLKMQGLRGSMMVLNRELMRELRISPVHCEEIIRELMLFNISDLIYAKVIDIENLNFLTEDQKNNLLKLRNVEFNKFLLENLHFKGDLRLEEKEKIILNISVSIEDVYQLMKPDYYDKINKIKEIDEPLSKNAGVRRALTVLKNSLNPDPLLKTNSTSSNSTSSNSPSSNSPSSNSPSSNSPSSRGV
jgi:hypothetical protein